ncbi:MAG: hypothetical protein Q8P97_01825 [bacterium]|nr:hypothetical protein [bacterium]
MMHPEELKNAIHELQEQTRRLGRPPLASLAKGGKLWRSGRRLTHKHDKRGTSKRDRKIK